MLPLQGRSPIINVSSNACILAGKKLLKDFLEIENLQVSKKDSSKFFSNTLINLEKSLFDNLTKARPEWLINPVNREAQKDAWIVSILSGKINFIHGIPHMAISVASFSNGTITSGCIYDPIRKELFYCELGKGSFLNEKRIRVSGRDNFIKSLINCGSEELSLDNMKKLKLSGSQIRISGCPALDLAWVASGRIDAYLDKIDLTEYLAGIILVKEAGGFCTDFSMTENIISNKEICAGNPSIHNNVIKTIRKAK
jgi:myo-inositol-1(or 4)-monophosphatase